MSLRKVFLKPVEAIQAMNKGKLIHYMSDEGHVTVRKGNKTAFIFSFPGAKAGEEIRGKITDAMVILNDVSVRRGIYYEEGKEDE